MCGLSFSRGVIRGWRYPHYCGGGCRRDACPSHIQLRGCGVHAQQLLLGCCGGGAGNAAAPPRLLHRPYSVSQPYASSCGRATWRATCVGASCPLLRGRASTPCVRSTSRWRLLGTPREATLQLHAFGWGFGAAWWTRECGRCVVASAPLFHSWMASTHRHDRHAQLPCSAFSGEPHSHPLAPSLRRAVVQHGHTRRWFDRLIEARVRCSSTRSEKEYERGWGVHRAPVFRAVASP